MSVYNITVRTDPLNPRSFKTTLSPEALAGVCMMAEAIYGEAAHQSLQIQDRRFTEVTCQPQRDTVVLGSGEDVFDYTPNQDWTEFVRSFTTKPTKKITARITGQFNNYLVHFNTPDFIQGMEQACQWLKPECEGVDGYLKDVHGA
jgi:hypothetical protein